MPVPIPQETDPFASPGEWVFINIEWLKIVLGTLSYALNDWYWAGSQDETSGVIQSTLKLIDGMGELLPPEMVKEVIKYVEREPENDNNDDDSEDDNMCKCPNAVHYDVEAKAFYYLDANCNRVAISDAPIPAGVGDWQNDSVPGASGFPDVPSDFEEYLKNTEALKCSKATALVNEMWNVVAIHEGFDEVEGLFNTIAFFAAAISTWAGAAGAAAVAASASSIGVSFLDLAANIGLDQLKENLEAITENEAVKSELICDLVERMTIKTNLEDAANLAIKKTSIYEEDVKIAIERFATLVPDSTEAVILLKVFPTKSWNEIVTPKIPGTLCGCEEYDPNPPPATEPEESEFGFYPGVLLGDFTTSHTPDTAQEITPVRGIKTSETAYETDANTYFDSDDDAGLLSVMFEATELVREVSIDLIYQYAGSAPVDPHLIYLEFYTFGSHGHDETWSLLASGTSSMNSSHPSWDGATPSINFPISFPTDASIITTQYKFLAFVFKCIINRDDGEQKLLIKNLQLRAKAVDGGNYRATLTPGAFVPKEI